MNPMSTTSVPATPSGRRDQDLDLGFGQEILDHGQRHVHRALGAEREVAHRLAVPRQHECHQIVGRAAGAKVDQLRAPVGRHGVGQALPSGSGLVRPAPEKVKTP